ncbi:MAG TPA: putative Ig domain-containing protein [Candidatus Sulfotelmatobacter sp.]|jgi:hypothetical protein
MIARAQITVVPLNKIGITLSPVTVALSSGAKQQFSATLTSTSNTAVTWQASSGTISSSGLYTAPSVSASSKAIVTATSVADGSVVASSQITVSPVSKLAISSSTVPAGTSGTFYSTNLAATGGTAPYSWQISAGALPQGLSLNKTTGVISGTTSQNGAFPFTTSVTDASSTSSSASFSLAMNEIGLTLSPATVTLSSGAKQQFSATLTSTSNTAVTWQASSGTISSSGLYTAPSVSASSKATVTATSVAEGSVVATSQVTVSPVSKLAISVHSMPSGTAGTAYSASLAASGGVAPYTWQITAGSLPQGLSLDKTTGAVSGTTSLTGTYPFTTSVTDSMSSTVSSSLSIAMSQSTSGTYDGPAELPRVYMQSAVADTPAPGSVITVAKGGDFQSALNSAKCGNTITLQAGAVFTGSFNFPAQTCDDGHWIIIRTSTADSSLPPENTRITPCYAGVSSLPGRPALHCASTKNVMAQIQYSGNASGPITFLNGASHYRFIGLEITRTPGTGIVYNLAFNQGNAANNIIFDRCWFHGTAQDETERGVMLAGSTYAAIVDSFFTDFHCVSKTGVCLDAQAIAGGLGDLVMGPYKIVDNFLEAAAESIIFGGGTATATPTDIEIRRNHMFKPMTWMQGQPGYVGGVDGNPFIVKNLFELKNAQRVLFEANILENTWGGFSQSGFGILLTPKNQAIGTSNVCPSCEVTDITIRYTTISHVGAGMQIGNGMSSNGGAPLAGERYSIHDLTIDDIDATKYDGNGDFAQISMGQGAPVLQSVTINHITAFQPDVMLNLGDDLSMNPPMNNFVFTNSIVNGGTSVTSTTGSGGTADCAYHPQPLTALGLCFSSYTFTHNAIIATPAVDPIGDYPSGNYFPSSVAAVEFVKYNGGNGGNYQLQSTSPYKNAGTDGLDLGADIATILADTVGVY